MVDHDLVLADCEVVTPTSVFRGWVSVADGMISGVGHGDPPRGKRVIGGGGRTLMPGRIEGHCHLRSANFDEDVRQVSRQAAAGGVTVLMPFMRATESYLPLVPRWTQAVVAHSYCDVSFHLQVQAPMHVPEILECQQRFGIQSYKVHLDARHSISDFNLEPVDDGDLYLAMLEVRQFDGSVAVHCENTEIARHLNERIRASGRADLAAWADIRSPIVEAADVNSSVFLASRVGCRLVVVHVSTMDSVEAAAIHRYPHVTFEAMIHSLGISLEDAQARVGGGAKTVPPLRQQAELERLWQGVESGAISMVGTDHSARSSALVGTGLDDGHVEFWEAREAATGIGVGTPLFLTAAIDRGVDLRAAARLMSLGPAKVYGLSHRKGAIAVGMDADLMLVDLDHERKASAGSLWSSVRTLAEGMNLRGWPVMTCLRGSVVYEDGEIVSDTGMAEVITQNRDTRFGRRSGFLA
jgi:dihydroorotase-like cyclic amidohydrolase